MNLCESWHEVIEIWEENKEKNQIDGTAISTRLSLLVPHK